MDHIRDEIGRVFRGAHMNEGSGLARKIFISFGGLFLVWLALSFGKAVYIFKTYIEPLFQ